MTARSTYECRALGHAWDVTTADWRAEFGLPLSLRCTRCGSERRDSVRPDDGLVLTRHYVHPDSYLSPDEPLPTRAEARLWLARDGAPRAAGGRRRLRAVKGA